MPIDWIGSVLNSESAGDVHAKSPKGAIGLMQIMPATWAKLRQRYDLGNDPFDPRDDILAGTACVGGLLDRYASPGVCAPHSADQLATKSISRGGPLPDETRAYVTRLANLLGIELSPTWIPGRRSSAAATLFVQRADLMKRRAAAGVRAFEAHNDSNLVASVSHPLACLSLDRIQEHRDHEARRFASNGVLQRSISGCARAVGRHDGKRAR